MPKKHGFVKLTKLEGYFPPDISSLLCMATFTQLRFRFYPFLLIKTLPVHIAPFSNEYVMKTIGVHTAPAKWCCESLFQNKAFVSSCQEDPNHEFECHCNQQSINNRNVKRFQMSPFLAFALKMDRFQNAPFSNLCASSAFSKSSVSQPKQCEPKAKTDKFYSVFM